MNTFDMVILVSGLVGVALYIDAFRDATDRRRVKHDDEVDFDDWKNGSPDDPVPDNAKPFKTDV